jgi:hypothetical protein
MAADLDLLSASLRADARDVDAIFGVLARKLAEALPDDVEIERGGVLGRSRPRAVHVTLGERRYECERRGSGVTCRRRTVVRGIAVRSEALELEEWIDALAADLLDQAERSERARSALQGLLEA